jgi:hypothetical protein
MEPEGVFPITFSGSGGPAKLETVAEGMSVRAVTCGKSRTDLEINSFTEFKRVRKIFKECTTKGPFGNVSCTGGEAAGAGEIVTNLLKARFVYIKAGSNEVGLTLEPEGATPFAKFTCGGIQTLSVSGSVVGKLTPVNTPTNTYTLTFTQSAGIQSPEGYLVPEGCAFTKDALTMTGSGFESFTSQAGLDSSETLTVSKNMVVASTSCS